MSEQTPTPEQIAAWEYIEAIAVDKETLELIRPFVSEALTNPQPALPTAPGVYVDKEDAPWSLDDGGRWWFGNTDFSIAVVDEVAHVREYAPFTRLVLERSPIKREQIRQILSVWNAGVYAEDEAIGRILALVNGTDR